MAHMAQYAAVCRPHSTRHSLCHKFHVHTLLWTDHYKKQFKSVLSRWHNSPAAHSKEPLVAAFHKLRQTRVRISALSDSLVGLHHKS